MERGWLADDDAAPVRVLRDIARLWARTKEGLLAPPNPSRAAERDGTTTEPGAAPPRSGKPLGSRAGTEGDPFAYVRVAVDPLEIHLD